MSKYAPLARYLSRRKDGELRLSFADVERLVGALLPKAAWSEAWWRADAATPQGRVFQAAGCEVEVDVGAEQVRFRRCAGAGLPTGL
ncbi:MAG: toxin-antitoxin system, antitoxin component [Brevundimonas sp.]